MINKVSFFLPTRKGSLRVKNKNTRPFASFNGGLLENKLRQLIKSERINEIILSTNDEECMAIAEAIIPETSKLKIIERPQHLCLDSTNLKDLIAYVPSITTAQHILWGHVTTPLFTNLDYDNAISVYLKKISKGFDSLISVMEFKNYLLNNKGLVVNNTTDLPWPRTQDLETLYEINHAVFLTNRNNYITHKNRVGDNPYLYITDKIKSVDVDWEDDFKIAEIMYEKYY